MRYPGYIMRQSLVDESQRRVEYLKKEAEKTFDMMNITGLDETSKTALSDQYSMLLGQIRAMRDINEWAREHTAPSLTHNNERC